MTATKLDTFTRGYVECAIWASTDDIGESLDVSCDVDDLAPETLAQIQEDCADFQAAQADLLAQAGNESQNGHDFWLTRNRHGAGFWDRGYGIVGRLLTDAAHVYGSCDLYVGDDGRIYC